MVHDAAIEELIEQINQTATHVVVAASGGGSRAISDFLERPGASRTLLEAVVPYSEAAMIAWLGGRPDHFCAVETARAMAVIALRRAQKYESAETPLAGIACTAGLMTDRPRRGPHRAHLAVQTAARTAAWSLELQKGRRSRAEEEQVVGRMVLNALADACGVPAQLDLPLLEGERVEHAQTIAPQPWQDLMLERAEAVCQGGEDRPMAAIFPGAFNPLHDGHRRMAALAGEMLSVPVAVEISILNVDKPPLDYAEIERRLGQFPSQQAVWLTRPARSRRSRNGFPAPLSSWASTPCTASPLRSITRPGRGRAWTRWSGSRSAAAASWFLAG